MNKSYHHHIQIGFDWLLTSIEATEGKGSAAYFHLWKGWAKSYPETTGYIIDTLFNGFNLLQDERLKKAAFQSADWLCKIQNDDGSFPSGVGGELRPIVFDVGMIAFGLTSAFQQSENYKYYITLDKAVDWMLRHLEPNGTWTKHAYVKHYFPSYYSMVAWSILKANEILKINGLEEKMLSVLDSIQDKMDNEKISIRDWGFRKNEPAFTHTIAYTLQGLLESSILANDEMLKKKVVDILEKVRGLRCKKKKLAGTYDANWKGDYSFSCLTGEAQFALLYFRLYQLFGNINHLEEGKSILKGIIRRQCHIPIKGIHGGLPGSYPIWGKYQIFRFPNWGMKFFLDALIMAHEIGNVKSR